MIEIKTEFAEMLEQRMYVARTRMFDAQVQCAQYKPSNTGYDAMQAHGMLASAALLYARALDNILAYHGDRDRSKEVLDAWSFAKMQAQHMQEVWALIASRIPTE